MGFMILCVCLDFLPLAAQHYTQTSITWQTAHMVVEISCVCGFPPSDPPHTQAISCQEVFIYGLQSLSNSWFQSLNNSVGKQIQSLNNSVSSRVCIFPPARSVWLCFESQTSTSQTLRSAFQCLSACNTGRSASLQLRNAGAERDLSSTFWFQMGRGRM